MLIQFGRIQRALFSATLCCCAAMQLTSGVARGQDISPQLQEATTFFTQLANTSQNPLIASVARENLSRLQRAETPPSPNRGKQIEVPLMSQQNNGLAVPAVLNGSTMGTFLVDTGASYTVITKRMAQKLGIEVTADTPKMSLITANGYIQAPIVTVERLSLGGVEVRNIKVVIQDLGNDPLLAGLLGMNFFKGMDLTVREDKLVLSLR